MPNDLINFWRKCKLTEPPFAHPDDLEIFRQKKGGVHLADEVDFDAYIAGPRFGDIDDKRLHLSLRPVPYVGDLSQAKIVILLLNPGLSYSDHWAESKMAPALFRQRLEESLKQSFTGVKFPFLKLDPQLCWCSGFLWWEKKLHGVINEIAKKLNITYIEALRDLSTKLACLELVPYHSSSFGAHALIKMLPSVKMAKRFVQESLVPEANARKRTLIVTRSAKDWGFERGTKSTQNIIIYKGPHTRGASLSPNSEGGKAVLRSYDIG